MDIRYAKPFTALLPPLSPHSTGPTKSDPHADAIIFPSQIYLYTEQLADRGTRKLEKKNIVFSKDGAKVGVKEVNAEDYTDRTQRAFVKTWNAAQGEK